jgi:hypothetical protein
MITRKQAEEVLPHVRAAVAALHDVRDHSCQVEQALGRDVDGLEGVIHDMAAGLNDPKSVDAEYVQQAVSNEVALKMPARDPSPAADARAMGSGPGLAVSAP